MYPDSVIIPFEDGYLATVSNVAHSVNSFEAFIDFIDKLEEHRAEIGDSIKTLVFDTVNKAYEKCEAYTLKQLSRLDSKRYGKPSDVPHGQFYPARDKYFAQQVDRILQLGFMPLFISHSEVKTITPKEGQPYDIYSSTMPERLEKIVYPLVSYIIFGERKMVEDGLGGMVSKRVLITKSNDMSTAGSRVRLNDDIIFDTEEEAMAKFQEAFRKSIQEKLDKAGIKENIDKLAKQQIKEKMEKVQEYIETNKLPNNDELIAKIKESFATATADNKTKAMAIMKANNITSFDNPDNLDGKVLVQILETLTA